MNDETISIFGRTIPFRVLFEVLEVFEVHK